MKSNNELFKSNDIDVRKLISTVWRRKFLILASAVVFCALGTYYTFRIADKIYGSYAIVMLNNQSEQIIDLPSIVSQLTNDETVVQSEIEVMRSRVLLGQVVEKLDLVNDPEFNHELYKPSILVRIKDAIKNRIVASTPENEPGGIDPAIATHDAVVSVLLKSFTASVVPNTTAFKITAYSKDPQKAARIADTIAEQYVQSQIDVKREATVQAIGWLGDQVSELRLNLEKTENAVKQFKTETPMTTPEVLAGLERQLKSIRERIDENRQAEAHAQQLLNALSAAPSDQEKASLANDPVLSAVVSRISDDPQASAEFRSRLDTLMGNASRIVAEAEAQIATLHQSETVLEGRIQKESDAFVQLEQLQREAEANRTLYEYFLGRLKETSAQQGIQQPDSRIISYAVVPKDPAQPNNKLNIVLAGFVGIAFGVGLAALLEARHRTLRTSQELEAHTGLPVIGLLPLVPVKDPKKVFSYLQENPTSPAVEAIRNLRTSVLLADIDHPPQVIMTTSSIPGEGKTTTSIGLALNFAGMSKKVLLIEADLRRLSLQQYFDRPRDAPGLISVLTEKKALGNTIWHDEHLGIDVLFGERSDSNAADVLSSRKMKDLIREMRTLYDVIIIDTPPALLVPDSRVVSQYVDAVLFVVKWDSTHQHQVDEALRLYDKTLVGGLVLNQIDPNGFRRYGYNYGYGYGYAAHYDDKYYLNE